MLRGGVIDDSGDILIQGQDVAVLMATPQGLFCDYMRRSCRKGCRQSKGNSIQR